MDSSSFLTLIQNAALLLSLLFLYDALSRFRLADHTLLRALLSGSAVGCIGIVIMLTPWHYQPGIIFDTRSVLLSISGLFLGPLPTLIAMAMTAIMRLLQGGGGALIGVVVILASGGIGIVWRACRYNASLTKLTVLEMYLFGLVVHAALLAAMCLFPWPVAAQILSDIALPVMLLLPLTTVGLGVLFMRRAKQDSLNVSLVKSEARLRSLYCHAPVALWEEDWSAVKQALNVMQQRGIEDVVSFLRHNRSEAYRLAGLVRILDVNDAALEQSGATSKQELLRHLPQFFNDATINDFIDVLAAFAGGESVYCCESPFLRLDGEQRILETRHVVMPGHEERLDFVIITTLDITARRMTEESLCISSSVYTNSSEAMSVTDAQGIIINVNPAFTEVTGYRLDEVVGNNHRILNSGRHDAAFYQAMWDALQSTGRWKGEVWNRRKNGEVYAEWLSINALRNAQGEIHRFVALFTDITQEKEFDEQLWRKANFDALTGLPNRRMFLDRLSLVVKKAQQAERSSALLLLDIDRLKEVNDSFGYQVGDRIIQEMAGRLQRCIGEADTLAHTGGDEFAIVLSAVADVDAVEHVVRTLQALCAEPVLGAEQPMHMTVSMGIAFYPGDASCADMLIQQASQALSTAKSQGRSRRQYFTPGMQETVQEKMFLATELRRAIADNQLSVCYQPILDLATGGVYKAEALIRWQHPQRGVINPAAFIPVAEETGLIVELGNWVYRQAVDQVAHWRRTLHPQFQISINKSPVQFRDEGNCLQEWFELLQQQALPGDAVLVELTEGLLMDSSPQVADKLIALAEAWIPLALDDFGTGYSSLAYLKKYDIDYLKIDQSFVQQLTEGSDDAALCESMIVMAHKLGIRVIAEGIETQLQSDLLKTWGCDFVQGYLIAPPLAASEFEQRFGVTALS